MLSVRPFLGSFLALLRFYDGCGGPAGLLFFIFLLPRKNSFLPRFSLWGAAYLTYLDGYFLFVRPLSFQSNEAIFRLESVPF